MTLKEEAGDGCFKERKKLGSHPNLTRQAAPSSVVSTTAPITRSEADAGPVGLATIQVGEARVQGYISRWHHRPSRWPPTARAALGAAPTVPRALWLSQGADAQAPIRLLLINPDAAWE